MNKVINGLQQPNLFHWIKKFALTGIVQTSIQLLSVVGGIIIIRLLPIKEYAYYTIANTMLGTMTLLSDGGISTGVMAEGGKVWQDKSKLSTIMSVGFRLREKFAIFSLLCSVPVLIFLLYKQEASVISIILITLTIIPAFYASLSDLILEIPLKLHQDLKQLQVNQLKVSAVRILLSICTLIFIPFTGVAMLANGLPRIYGNIGLRNLNKKFIDSSKNSDKEIEKRIVKIVKRMMPEMIYYCFSGQITVWILATFGDTNSIAQIGALGRIGIITTVFASIFGVLIQPRYARLADIKRGLVRNFTLVIASLSLLLFGIIIGVWFTSDFILNILGESYKGLNTELCYVMVSSSLGLLAGISYALATSRGWVMKPVVSVTINLLSSITLISLLDVSTLIGALKLNIGISAILFFVNASFFIFSINKHFNHVRKLVV